MSTEHQAWKNDPDYDRTHARRFQQSLEWLRPHLRPGQHSFCLGDGGFIEREIEKIAGRVVAITEDLRDPFARNHDIADLVICAEVFEHIHDREATKPTEWRATGTEILLRESFTLLKPGGLLFLTTPNACSLNVLFKVLTMQAPMVYRPHVREYSPEEIAGMLKAAGFVIERFETLDVWGGGCTGTTRTIVDKLLADYGHPSPHRGEDIFVLARKPGPTPEKLEPNKTWGIASLDREGQRLGLFYGDRAGGRHCTFIPAYVQGAPKCEDTAWCYTVAGDVLHITPSLLIKPPVRTGDPDRFHSDYHWSIHFTEKPAGIEQYNHLHAINGIDPSS